jgi:PAS domain S-box-containing protein
MVADQRFGPRTRALLTSVEPFPEQFERARSPAPDTGVFQGFAPSLGKMAWGVGRRLEHAGWTIFYMAPEENLTNQLADATRERLLLALGILGAALLVGVGFSASILRPVRELAGATASLAEGADAARARVPVRGNDEFARLAASFNTMADRLAAQSASLRQANDVLEARVRERTGLLNGIIENSTAVIHAKDLDGRFLLANDLFCKLLGVRREDVLGRTGRDLFDPATADALRQVDERVARSAHALIEEEQVSLDGRMRTYLSSKAPLRGEDGAVHGIVGVSTDITERKLAEVRQLAQLERLSLLDQISTAIGARHDLHSIYGVVVGSLEERMPVDMCAICSFDPATGTLAVSRIGARGRELALATGLVDSPPAVIPIDGNGLARCVRGELVYEADLRDSAFAFPQGLARAGCHCVVLAPLMAENRVFGVLIAARCEPASFSSTDCEFLRQLSGHVALAAQQAQLTQALQRAYDELRQSQQSLLQQERLSALGQMASGIAHDINNAISPASLYAESLLEQEKSLSEHARSRLTIIARAIDDVAATVARMREFYRHREPQSAMQPMDLNELVRQVVDLTRARWHDMPQQRGTVIALHMDLQAPLPPVSGIESEIREALINLVFNAVDAMPQGGRLTVATRFDRAEGDVLVEVSDTGVGMDAETQRRCLEPFFTTKGERGTGLGLAMVYGVAQRNDADIDIRSAPGQGTTVRLRMPAGADDGARSRGVPEMQVPAARRILVVDDDVLVLRSLQEALDADGHSVTQAQGGEAGVAAFLQALRYGRPYDVVFTDLGMPGMDGLQVAQEIKRASPGTPVVLLTGWGQRLSESGDAELPPHVDRVLSKPPRLRELRAALAQGDAARGGTAA